VFAKVCVLKVHTDGLANFLPVINKIWIGYQYTGSYQQTVKSYKGIEDARVIFAKARSGLADPEKTDAKRESTYP
jgi:hypothetical protein